MGGVFEVFHGRDHYSPLLALPGRGVGAGRAGAVVGGAGGGGGGQNQVVNHL